MQAPRHKLTPQLVNELVEQLNGILLDSEAISRCESTAYKSELIAKVITVTETLRELNDGQWVRFTFDSKEDREAFENDLYDKGVLNASTDNQTGLQ